MHTNNSQTRVIPSTPEYDQEEVSASSVATTQVENPDNEATLVCPDISSQLHGGRKTSTSEEEPVSLRSDEDASDDERDRNVVESEAEEEHGGSRQKAKNEAGVTQRRLASPTLSDHALTTQNTEKILNGPTQQVDFAVASTTSANEDFSGDELNGPSQKRGGQLAYGLKSSPKTQALLSATTQALDLEVPPPPGGWEGQEGDGNGNEGATDSHEETKGSVAEEEEVDGISTVFVKSEASVKSEESSALSLSHISPAKGDVEDENSEAEKGGNWDYPMSSSSEEVCDAQCEEGGDRGEAQDDDEESAKELASQPSSEPSTHPPLRTIIPETQFETAPANQIPKSAYNDTQALLSRADTQPPDFSIAAPDGGWDSILSSPHAEDQGTADITLRSSSPPPAPPVSHPETSTSPLDAFITHLTTLGHPQSSILTALQLTSLDAPLAERVLRRMSRGKRWEDMKGVWTEEDDADLESTDARRVQRVERKHGLEGVLGREEFLREWRG